eukprot:Amastigsp_a841369_8.p4 type:complete len:204 gc:universal Amastigsp_a841369_8:650-39(-)
MRGERAGERHGAVVSAEIACEPQLDDALVLREGLRKELGADGRDAVAFEGHAAEELVARQRPRQRLDVGVAKPCARERDRVERRVEPDRGLHGRGGVERERVVVERQGFPERLLEEREHTRIRLLALCSHLARVVELLLHAVDGEIPRHAFFLRLGLKEHLAAVDREPHGRLRRAVADGEAFDDTRREGNGAFGHRRVTRRKI